MSYEYFASTLPSFSFGAPPPMEAAALLASAEGNLSAKDFAALAALLSDGPSDHPFVRAWRDRETQLRNAVARARAARLCGAEAAARWTRPHGGWSVPLETGVAAAFQEKDPLRRHAALARLRWDAAVDLAGLNPFSAEAVLAYAVRLLVAADLAKADADAGLARLRKTAETPAATDG